MVKNKINLLVTFSILMIVFAGLFTPAVQPTFSNPESNENLVSNNKLQADEVDSIDSFEVTPRTGRWNISQDNSYYDHVFDGIYTVGSFTTDANNPSNLTMSRALEKTDSKGEYRFKGYAGGNVTEYFRDFVGDEMDFNENDAEGLTFDSPTVSNGILTISVAAGNYLDLGAIMQTGEKINLNVYDTLVLRSKYYDSGVAVGQQIALSGTSQVNGYACENGYVGDFYVNNGEWTVSILDLSRTSYYQTCSFGEFNGQLREQQTIRQFFRYSATAQTWDVDYIKILGDYEALTHVRSDSSDFEDLNDYFNAEENKIQDFDDGDVMNYNTSDGFVYQNNTIDYFESVLNDAWDFNEDNETLDIYVDGWSAGVVSFDAAYTGTFFLKDLNGLSRDIDYLFQIRVKANVTATDIRPVFTDSLGNWVKFDIISTITTSWQTINILIDVVSISAWNIAALRLFNYQSGSKVRLDIDYIRLFSDFELFEHLRNDAVDFHDGKEYFETYGQTQDYEFEYFADSGDALDFTEDTEGWSISGGFGDVFSRVTTSNGMSDGSGNCYSFTNACAIEKTGLSINAATYTHFEIEFRSELELDFFRIYDYGLNTHYTFTDNIPAMERVTLTYDLDNSAIWSGTETGFVLWFQTVSGEGWFEVDINQIRIYSDYIFNSFTNDKINDFDTNDGYAEYKGFDNFDYFYNTLGNTSNFNDGTTEYVDTSYNSPNNHDYSNDGSGNLNISTGAYFLNDVYDFQFTGLSIDSSVYRFLSIRWQFVGSRSMSFGQISWSGGNCGIYNSWFAGSGFSANTWYVFDLDLESSALSCSGWGSGTKTYLLFQIFMSGAMVTGDYLLIDYITLGSTGSLQTDDVDSLFDDEHSIITETFNPVVTATSYFWFTAEFYTSINITQIDIYDAGGNSLYTSSTVRVGGSYHLISTRFITNWSGTESGLIFNFTVVSETAFTVRFEIFMLSNQEKNGLDETVSSSGSPIAYSHPDGYLFQRAQETSSGFYDPYIIMPKSLSYLDFNVFSNLTVRMKTNFDISSYSFYISFYNSIGSFLGGDSTFTTPAFTNGVWQTFSVDLSAHSFAGLSNIDYFRLDFFNGYLFGSGQEQYYLIDYIHVLSTYSYPEETVSVYGQGLSSVSIQRSDLSINSTKFGWFGSEIYFYSLNSSKIINTYFYDSGNNLIGTDASDIESGYWFFIKANFTADADYTGTETNITIVFETNVTDSFFVSINILFLYEDSQAYGDSDGWIGDGSEAYYFVHPLGYIVNGHKFNNRQPFIAFDTSTTLMSDIDISVFPILQFRVKAEQQFSTFGNILIQMSLYDSSAVFIGYQNIITTDISDWTVITYDLRDSAYWTNLNGEFGYSRIYLKDSNVKMLVDSVFFLKAESDGGFWDIYFNDWLSQNAIRIRHDYINNTHFRVELNLYDAGGLITSTLVSNWFAYDFQEYYIAKFDYDTLTSDWSYDLFYENNSRIFNSDYPEDYTDISSIPYFFTLSLPPRIELNFESNQSYSYFESWIDYIQIDYKARDWIRDNYETDSTVLVNTVEELQTVGNTDISNSWNLTIANLDAYSGDFRFNSSDNELLRSEGSIDNYAFSLTLWSYDRDSGIEARVISIGFFWSVISGNKIATGAVLYTLDNFIVVPSSYYIFDTTNSSDASPFMSFSVALSENRKQAVSFLRIFPNEDDETTFTDYTLNATVDNNAAQEFKLQLVHAHHDYDVNTVNHKSQFVNFAFREKDIFADIGNAVFGVGDAIISGIVQPIINFFQEILLAIFRFALSFINVIILAATSLVTAALDALGALITAAIDTMKLAITAAVESLGNLLDATLQVIKGVLDGIASSLTTIANTIVTLATDIINGVVNGLNTVFQLIIDGLEAALELAIGLVEDAVNALATFLSDILDEILALAGYIVDQIINLAFDILDALIAALMLLIDVVVDLLFALLDFILVTLGIKDLFTALVDLVVIFLVGLVELILDIVDFVVFMVSIFAFSLPMIVLIAWVYILLMPFKQADEIDEYLEIVRQRASISIVGDLSIVGVKLKPFSYLGVVNLVLTFVYLAII